jgi:uncharacterized membrane protein YbhN (UPF0104 family)
VKRALPWLRWVASALVLALAAWLLWRQLRTLSLAQLQAALRAMPPAAIALSLLATAVSFACLAGYERLATQWIAPGRIPRGTAWRVGMSAHAVANTLGFHPLTAVALRLRSYRALGIDAATLAKIVASVGACVVTGMIVVVLVALGWSQVLAGRGAMVVALAAFGAAALALLRMRLRLGRQALSPVYAHVGRVAGIGLLEMGADIAALAVLVPAGALPGGPAFVLLFVSAILLGVVSHAPGGIGVFEAVMLAAAPPARRAEVLAALLAYRGLCNLLPFAIASLALGLGWLRRREASSMPGTRA